MGLTNDEGRPLAGPASNVNHIDASDSTTCTRCERCSRPLTAAVSVERGLGPVCCRQVVAA